MSYKLKTDNSKPLYNTVVSSVLENGAELNSTSSGGRKAVTYLWHKNGNYDFSVGSGANMIEYSRWWIWAANKTYNSGVSWNSTNNSIKFVKSSSMTTVNRYTSGIQLGAFSGCDKMQIKFEMKSNNAKNIRIYYGDYASGRKYYAKVNTNNPTQWESGTIYGNFSSSSTKNLFRVEYDVINLNQEANVELKNIKYECLKKSGYGTTPAGYETLANSGYRYGFNGMEKDDEWKGKGNSVDFGARGYDLRLGRWLSVDQYANLYAPISPYAFGLNNSIRLVDRDGNKIWDPASGEEVIVTFTSENMAVYTLKSGGQVSEEFLEKAKPILDIMSQSEAGRHDIQTLMGIPTKVYIDPDSKFEGFEDANSNFFSMPNPKDDKGDIKFNRHSGPSALTDKGYYKAVVIKPNIENIKEMAVKTGVSYEEKMTTTMNVEVGHIATTGQIAYEDPRREYVYKSPEVFKFAYNVLLNDAVRAAISYRNSQNPKIPLSNSVFAPIEGPKALGNNVKLDRSNKKIKKSLNEE